MSQTSEKTYTVKSPIKRGGKRIEPGKTVTMPESDAKPLIALGALAEAKGNKPATNASSSTDTLTDEQKVAALVEAIAQLDADNEDHWTKDGRPDAKALEGLVEFKVSATLRDQAFSATKPQEG